MARIGTDAEAINLPNRPRRFLIGIHPCDPWLKNQEFVGTAERLRMKPVRWKPNWMQRPRPIMRHEM